MAAEDELQQTSVALLHRGRSGSLPVHAACSVLFCSMPQPRPPLVVFTIFHHYSSSSCFDSTLFPRVSPSQLGSHYRRHFFTTNNTRPSVIERNSKHRLSMIKDTTEARDFLPAGVRQSGEVESDVFFTLNKVLSLVWNASIIHFIDLFVC